MKAKDLRLQELLDFRPDQGCVYLKQARVVIINADALGTLRNDLIKTLGFERAKGFLIRYGWSCGNNDAVSIMKRFEWDNEAEWSRAGEILSALEGVALVESDAESPACDNGKWVDRGTWSNSYEAEQHLMYFGRSNSPVCWTLVGYAGGHISAFLGKKVIYKETECVGKGDSVCRWVGKTIEEWGEEIISELPYYEESKIGEELEEANRRIKAQHAMLQQAVSIHDQLTQRVLEGGDIDAITQTLSSLIGCTVIVEDTDFRVISVHSPHSVVFPDKSISLKPFRGSYVRNKYRSLARYKRPQILKVVNYSGHEETRVVAPIMVGSDILGYVSIVKDVEEFLEMESMALEHAATVYALVMMKENAVIGVELKLKGDFLDDLVNGNYGSNESIVSRARRLGCDISLPHRLLLVEIDDFTSLVLQRQLHYV